MPACSCGREIKVGESSGEAALVVAVVKKIENGGSCCCCTIWGRKIRAHGGSDRFEQGGIELPAAASLGPLPTDGERVRQLLYERDVRERVRVIAAAAACCA